MPTTWDPTLTSAELLALTRLLGEPHRDLAVLAEGNTSQRLADGRLVVKASGAHLAAATAEDFVVVDTEEVMAIVTEPTSTQEDLTAALVVAGAARPDGFPRRASIETVVHAAVQHVAARMSSSAAGDSGTGNGDIARFVGHTHPTDVVGILASVHAAQAWACLVYSDEAVVIGRPLFVPYASPGISLGRIYAAALLEYTERYGVLPQLVLLANHGIVAIAPTTAGVEAVSTMAVKGARVRATAYAVGGVAPLTPEQVTSFFAREDIDERRANLARGR